MKVRNIKFYINYWQQVIKDLLQEYQNTKSDNEYFSKLHMKYITTLDIRQNARNIIEINNKRIKDIENEIKLAKERMAQFISFEESYKEDFKNKIYYDKDTGSVIQQDNDDIPDNVYIP